MTAKFKTSLVSTTNEISIKKPDSLLVDQHQTSQQVWSQFKSGDRHAFATIYQQYTSILTQYGMRLVRDKELVRDAVQDLFVRLWDSKERLGEVASIKSYLFASLRRELSKRVSRSSLSLDNISTSDFELTAEDSTESLFIEGEHAAMIDQKLSLAVDKLPLRQQEAIFLKYYSELEFSQVAQVMSITNRAVYKLIYKAITHLQKSFDVHLFTLAFLLFLL